MLPKILLNTVRAISSSASNFRDVISKLRPLAIASPAFDKLVDEGYIVHIANIVYINRPFPERAKMLCKYDSKDLEGAEMSWNIIRTVMSVAPEKAQGFFEAYRVGDYNIIVAGRSDKVKKIMQGGDISPAITLEGVLKSHLISKNNDKVNTYIPLVCSDDETAEYVLKCIAEIDYKNTDEYS